MGSKFSAQRVAAKFTNVVDHVEPAPHTPVPGFTVIKVNEEEIDFHREKTRDTGAFWDEYNDLTLGHLTGLDRKGDCE